MQEHLSITNPEAARALTETKASQLLIPFMKCPLSLSDAAKELGVKLPRLSYHVNRFIEFGLLEVICTERRGGRSVKLYRSTAKTFFIPFHVTPSESLEHLVTQLLKQVASAVNWPARCSKLLLTGDSTSRATSVVTFRFQSLKPKGEKRHRFSQNFSAPTNPLFSRQRGGSLSTSTLLRRYKTS